jgi:hypothetical protein
VTADDRAAGVSPQTPALAQALRAQADALVALAEYARWLEGRDERRPDAASVAGDPGDLRDDVCRLQASLAALVPRVAAASLRVRDAHRAARAARNDQGPGPSGG